MIPPAEDDVAASTTSGAMIGSPKPPACAATVENATITDAVIRNLRM